MKLKTGYKWKSIEGLSKGKTFIIVKVCQKEITYKSEETGTTYTAERKFFEKYMERVNKYWSDKTKAYKKKKEKLKEIL